MNQNHNKFYSADSICIEQLDNFFLNKSIIKPEIHKESILFSAFINKNKSFRDKLLLNFFPELVEEVVQEEFGRKLDTELIDILIKDFNFKAFENFSLPSKKHDSISPANAEPFAIVNQKALFEKDSDAHLLLRNSSQSHSVTTSHPSNTILTCKKETEKLDKMQKLFASQKPTEPKLNNSLKHDEKSDKENSNPNHPSDNKKVNIKEQKIIFFNKQKAKEIEEQSDANLSNKENLNPNQHFSNNENLNPNQQFNSKFNARYETKSKGNLGYAYKGEARNEEFTGHANNFDVKHSHIMGAPETKPSYYQSKKEYFYNCNANPVVNENAFYNNHFQKEYNANRGFIPRLKYHKRCKQTEWNRLWWSTEERRDKFSGKDGA